MSIKNWAINTANLTFDHGISGLKKGMKGVYMKSLHYLGDKIIDGEDIFSKEWDVLIILDACREDILKSKIDEYTDTTCISNINSRNTTTQYWMRKNFNGKYIETKSNSIYVSGNPFSESELNDNDWHSLDHVWKRSWTSPGTVSPTSITDSAVWHWRETSSKKMIVHYMQPHYPYLSAPDLGPQKNIENFGTSADADIWSEVELGNIDISEVRKAYVENLEIVLEDIFKRLLTNLDAEKVVISADHGEAFGEYGIYGHGPNIPLECLSKVPWIEVNATDTKSINPDEPNENEHGFNRDDQLRALGYR